MNPEKQSLIENLISHDDPSGQRMAALRAGVRVLRVRRWKRRAAFGLSGSALLCLLILGLWHASGPKLKEIVTVKPVVPPEPQIQKLTDNELLALFPDTPVGLVAVGEGKRLIFLRPGDEERFITRL